MNGLTLRLEEFLSELPMESIAEDVASRSGFKVAAIASGSGLKSGAVGEMLQAYVNETHVSLSMIQEHVRAGQRILEVGAGLCLLSLFLKREGFDVVALEPALAGHELFEQARLAILEHFSDIPLQVLDCPAQKLDVSAYGSFDLIFSNNVIEHILDWQEAMDAMRGVLAEKGYMLHGCPNYTVPYEPHYGVPVFRGLPELSRRLFLSKKVDAGIWDSLNFITYSQLKGYCSRHGLNCTFKKGLLYQALKRVDEDAVFRQRHQGIVTGIATLLLRSGLAKLMGKIPPGLATPMVVRIDMAVAEGR